MKISVITAVYNSEATVGDAIMSVASQTYPDLEHLVIDGRSTDGSLARAKAAAHDRMTLHSEPDKGVYDALNKGIEQATGDVIGFVHSDDFLAHSAVLLRIANAFDDPDVDAVFGNLDYVSQTDTRQVIRHWSSGPFTPAKLRQGWMPAHPTLYLRKEVYDRYGTYDTRFAIAADYDFILRYFSQIDGKSEYIPEVLYKMRIGGISNRNLTKVRQKMREDYEALRRNQVGGIGTLARKNLSKIGQFVRRPEPRS